MLSVFKARDNDRLLLFSRDDDIIMLIRLGTAIGAQVFGDLFRGRTSASNKSSSAISSYYHAIIVGS